MGDANFSDEKITEKIALKISTVYSCVNVRALTRASLPVNVFREKNDRKEVMTDHPVYWLLSQEPNNYMSSPNMWMNEGLMEDLWGNSYFYIHRDGLGRPESFQVLCAWDVDARLIKGQAFYVYEGEAIPARDVLHFRGLSYDGLCGISAIRANADTFGAARRQDRYSTMAIGKRPPGILSYDGNISPTTMAQNQKSWENDLLAGRVPVLGGSWKYQSIIIPPGDAEIIASKKMTKTDILGIFQVPPSFVQDYERATWANAEQADLTFAKHTITPIVNRIEKECNMKLFTEKEKNTHFVKFNMNGLLRGDLAARQGFYQSMVNSGVMNRNEVRSLEDLNSYPGGDEFLVQGAMVPADMLRKKYEQEVLPTVPTKPKNYVNGYVN